MMSKIRTAALVLLSVIGSPAAADKSPNQVLQGKLAAQRIESLLRQSWQFRGTQQSQRQQHPALRRPRTLLRASGYVEGLDPPI